MKTTKATVANLTTAAKALLRNIAEDQASTSRAYGLPPTAIAAAYPADDDPRFKRLILSTEFGELVNHDLVSVRLINSAGNDYLALTKLGRRALRIALHEGVESAPCAWGVIDVAAMTEAYAM